MLAHDMFLFFFLLFFSSFFRKAALLAKDQIISNNAKAFLKELILRRDTRISELLEKFETKEADNTTFVDSLHDLIGTARV
jgi:hypothetical protein